MISTELFTWDKEDRTLVACVSDGELHQLFKRSIPSAFMLKSHWTGKEEIVYLDGTVTSSDGSEVKWYEYKPFDKRFTVIIFND